MAEMGLWPYKELLRIRRADVDLESRLVHIPDSKTPNGIGDMPMTEQAWTAFKAQLEQSAGSEYLFSTQARRSRT
jgi:integrase